MPFLADVLSQALNIYMFIVFVNVILSWVVFSTQNEIIRQIYSFTGQLVDPILQPIRRVMQPMSRNIGIDFSPMVLLFLLYILSSLLET